MIYDLAIGLNYNLLSQNLKGVYHWQLIRQGHVVIIHNIITSLLRNIDRMCQFAHHSSH